MFSLSLFFLFLCGRAPVIRRLAICVKVKLSPALHYRFEMSAGLGGMKEGNSGMEASSFKLQTSRFKHGRLREFEQLLHFPDAAGHGQLLPVEQDHGVIAFEEGLELFDLFEVDEG